MLISKEVLAQRCLAVLHLSRLTHRPGRERGSTSLQGIVPPRRHLGLGRISTFSWRTVEYIGQEVLCTQPNRGRTGAVDLPLKGKHVPSSRLGCELVRPCVLSQVSSPSFPNCWPLPSGFSHRGLVLGSPKPKPFSFPCSSFQPRAMSLKTIPELITRPASVLGAAVPASQLCEADTESVGAGSCGPRPTHYLPQSRAVHGS